MPIKTYTRSNELAAHSVEKKPRFSANLNLSGMFLAFTVIFVLVASALTTKNWLKPPIILSPITTTSVFQFLNLDPKPKNSKVVYGFLPYWNLDEVQLNPSLTHVAYFGLGVAGDGSLITRTDEGAEPGFNKLKSDEFLDLSAQMKQRNQKIELVLPMFNNDDIVAFLNSSTAQQKFYDSIDSVLLAYPFAGINIDIEYTGEVNDHLRANMVEFVTNFNQHLDTKYDSVTLSIDMYASAASDNDIWDIAQIAKQVDYIVIMAYDFHRRSSPVAGPVAPLFGGKSLWDSDISEHLREYLKKVPAEKILLGVPFYGYEWQTENKNPRSFTLPDTGSTASYKRVQNLLAEKEKFKVQEGWSEEALSPYLIYEENRKTYVVYYENSRSLSYKLDYVNQLDLAGVAIWALGYEGDHPELWEVINRKFTLQP